MKKTSYGTFISPIFKHFKQVAKSSKAPFDEVLFCFASSKSIESFPREMDNSKELAFAEFYCAFLWRFRNITHYFLEDGLAEFLVGAVKDNTSDFYKPFPEYEEVSVPKMSDGLPLLFGEWAGRILENGQAMAGGFAIHFPSKYNRGSIIVVPKLHQRNRINGSKCTFHTFASSDGIDIALDHPGHDSATEDDEAKWKRKLIYGLSLYIDAFPSAVVESSGSIHCQMPNEKKQKKFTVSHNVASSNDVENSKSPHWRRGHFRVYSSDHFKKMKGKTVFIEGCFIKGKSFDVLKDAN